MTLRASVIITTHNEGASIRATLLGLAQDRAFREGWAEVVLVDDRSTDDTVAQALSVDLPALRLLHAAPDPASPLTTRQQALDLGFRAAASPIILTLDADSTLPRDWIAQMIAPIEAGQTQATAGPIGFAPLTSGVARWQCCDTAYYFLVSGLMARAGLGGGVFFGNFAFRADLYTRLGSFDAIGFALTEDLAFALALGLTVWPLTLLGLAIATALGAGATVAAALLLRYLTGVMIVIRALGPRRSARLYVAALGYEPAVFGLAAAALLRRLARRGIAWGGKTYGQ